MATTKAGQEGTNTGLNVNDTGVIEDAIQTEVDYLIRDPKHEHEKPYEIRYDPGGVIPETNMSDETRPILVHDFRPFQNCQSFSEYGFSSARIECAVKSTEFDDEQKVKEVYYPEIKKLMWQRFPGAAEIKILEHGLRKRHEQFPTRDNEEFFETLQPSRIAHMDFSIESAARTACAAFNMGPNQYRRLLTVNIWKSFQGPGNDWPLALCDWRSIDRRSESVVVDVVYHNRFTENESLYYSPNHKWYYFKDLGDDEVILFQQTDSTIEGGGGVAHVSFFNPKADKNAAPRASIELRAFVFYV
ncbi:hypothetical protein F5882DRAFT_308780 [Hyaloscypha sp. PMI_1271]|nr:hypothetical protein F5882DRAFT_308780 [Hyaloscypha sp. PMI_1271]